MLRDDEGNLIHRRRRRDDIDDELSDWLEYNKSRNNNSAISETYWRAFKGKATYKKTERERVAEIEAWLQKEGRAQDIDQD